jgi:hypothetical protein
MQSIYIKYENLKKFTLTIDQNNEWITWLQTVPYEAFHFTIKDKMSKNLSQDDMYQEIISTAKIEPNKISDTQKTTLLRYIEYFSEIAKLF